MMTRAITAALGTVVLAAGLTACGSGDADGQARSAGSAGGEKTAGSSEQSASAGGGSKVDACRLVSQAVLEKALGSKVGAGKRKTTPAPDLNSCSYKPSPTSYVLVQATGKADTFFPASMYPVKGQKTVPVPGADRGYATPVTNAGPLDASQVFVVKDGMAVQVTVSVPGSYTTDDMVALGTTILGEL